MAKTNFTKVEGSLSEGLRKMDVNRLLDISEGEASAEQLHARGQLLAVLQYELKSLFRQGQDLYKQLNVDKKELKKFAENLQGLTQQDVDRLKKIKEQVDVFKVEFAKKQPQTSDDDVVTKERRKHINKRFNINDNWLPLR